MTILLTHEDANWRASRPGAVGLATPDLRTLQDVVLKAGVSGQRVEGETSHPHLSLGGVGETPTAHN